MIANTFKPFFLSWNFTYCPWLACKSCIYRNEWIDPRILIFVPKYVSLSQSTVLSFSIFPGGSEVKASASNAGDPGSIPGLGRSPGEGNGNPLQYSCLENPMDLKVWSATIHGVAKSRARLSDFTSLQAWPHPSEQDPVFPSVSLSHQEASISLSFFSITGQTDWKPQSQKTNQSDHMDHSLV